MSDFTKIIELDDETPEGEPTVQVLHWGSNVKLASEASDYIQNVKPVPGKTIVLVLAMGASEYYGCNRNGDAFAEQPIPGVIAPGETLLDTYKTFEQGHAFRHHQNNDPTKSLGKVIKSFYNHDQHRVELLIEVDNDLGADIVEKINAGAKTAVSMGCKIKYDICNICGNKAPTRAQYCQHARNEMSRLYPDGRQSFVWNPAPRFFDISFVFRPADRIGYMMKKVANHAEQRQSSAELGEMYTAFHARKQAAQKLSEMDKLIRGEVADYNPKDGTQLLRSFIENVLPALLSNTPPLDNEALGSLAAHPLPTALSTLSGMGISPTTNEITQLMMQRASPGAQLPQQVQRKMAALSGGALALIAEHPEILEALQKTGMLELDPQLYSQKLASTLQVWMEKRSNLKEYMYRRMQPVFGEAHPDVGNWDMVNVRDPRSGQTYQTTQGAMDASDDVNVERHLKLLAGMGLLTGAGYKVLSTMPGGRQAAPLALAAGALATKGVNDLYKVPSFKREGGPVAGDIAMPGGSPLSEDVGINTEMRKQSGDAVKSIAYPLASSAAITAMLAQEYNKRQARGELGTHPGGLQKFVEGAGEVASNHPLATFMAGLGAIGLGANHAGQLEKFFKKAEDDSAGVKSAEVDLEGLALWLGEALF